MINLQTTMKLFPIFSNNRTNSYIKNVQVTHCGQSMSILVFSDYTMLYINGKGTP